MITINSGGGRSHTKIATIPAYIQPLLSQFSVKATGRSHVRVAHMTWRRTTASSCASKRNSLARMDSTKVLPGDGIFFRWAVDVMLGPKEELLRSDLFVI